MLQLYYTLGRAFGRALRYLEPPTFGSFLFFGLPEKQNGVEVRGSLRLPAHFSITLQRHTGDLDSFKQALRKQAAEDSYERKLDEGALSPASFPSS